MNLYTILVQSHSILRYVALLFLLIAIAKSFSGVLGKTSFHETNLKIPLWAMITFHIQVLVGLILYLISPKVQFTGDMMKTDILRFFTMEHVLLMLISVALITVGYVRAKKKMESGNKQIFIFYTIALVLVLAAIPWPFREILGAKWL